jgi:hypothetical protein
VAVERRGERAGRHRVLNEREPIVGVRSVGHEANSDAAEEARLSIRRSKDLRCGNGHGA